MKLKRIATVSNGVTKDVDDWSVVRSKLVFEEQYVEGLYRLSRFQHVLVIFGFHKKRKTLMRVHPRHDLTKPLVGVFASRSPKRPNRIGLTRAKLISIRGNVVTVQGLDAYDGSPVFDLKPPTDEIDY
ncbi:MAG: tRNA (N6-threonylcarbamoyladenosine(37)-N6)-methyltransferase TrmO [Methanobacteriota archaeon]|nr:MAG: tRNA (N6-threonylcarbamoyladenosine(37)-N6)-methyltransferase TrmO [Euryarchaeota archaeon]